jgi:hypothetical protein
MTTFLHLWQYLAECFLEWENCKYNCREYKNTHFIFDNFSRNRAVSEIMWKNVVEPERPQMTIWRMHFACWITKATDTRSEYVTFIAFPWQQWFCERASVLRYTYVASLGSTFCLHSYREGSFESLVTISCHILACCLSCDIFTFHFTHIISWS